MIKHIDDNNFDSELKNTKGVCLVDFYATWCGPCMMLAPVLEEIASSRANYNIMKVDVDQAPAISSELKIDTIPTLCVYKDGVLMEKHIGYQNKEKIVEMLEKYNA